MIPIHDADFFMRSIKGRMKTSDVRKPIVVGFTALLCVFIPFPLFCGHFTSYLYCSLFSRLSFRDCSSFFHSSFSRSIYFYRFSLYISQYISIFKKILSPYYSILIFGSLPFLFLVSLPLILSFLLYFPYIYFSSLHSLIFTSFLIPSVCFPSLISTFLFRFPLFSQFTLLPLVP